MRIELPNLCVVALMGASGCGKSTFAAKHFKTTEVLSSDYYRGVIADSEEDMSATKDAFDVLYYIANKRLDRAKLTVVDATNVQPVARQEVLALAKEQNCFAVAIVFDYPEGVCQQHNEARTDHKVPFHAIKNHTRDLKRSIKYLRKEGFRYVYIIKSPEEAEAVEIVRTKLWNDKGDEQGPFDIIGDIHGCYDELCDLLEKLDYIVDRSACTALPPADRKAVFLGDLCDRGPKNIEVLRLVMRMVEKGYALCVPGNHDVKLLKYMRGTKVSMGHGLDITMEQLEKQTPEFIAKVKEFIDSMISHYMLDNGNLVVAHAGLQEKYQGRGSGKVRQFCLYGETTGETDEFGLPVRLNWAEEYRGTARVVYGHMPALEVQSLNKTEGIDTGCVFGGKLTAYRYPEEEIVQVKAYRQYYEPVKPLANQTEDVGDLLNIRDVQGKRYLTTRLRNGITVHEDNAAAALEIMSRYAADPHWLIYLPPTMSPCETSKQEGYLEHPMEAFNYFKNRGVEKVVCEQKHMGSRAVITLCQNAQVAKERFGVEDDSIGLIYTRTGRHFFNNAEQYKERTILERLQVVLEKSGFWDAFSTQWVCLDTELMPWSAKAQGLLVDQYAPVGRAGKDSLSAAVLALQQAVKNKTASYEIGEQVSGQNINLNEILAKMEDREKSLQLYTDAYRQYCWPVNEVEDYRIAPFHILATEGKVWNEENHIHHMEVIKRYMTGEDPLFMATNHIVVDLNDEAKLNAGVDWWQKLTDGGGEGMVVKPFDFIALEKGNLLQPAVKCRGSEYLRIIYGPEYLLGDHLQRLKRRSLTKKRRLALNEFALGMESLERFVNKEPLYRVHECVFAVLAMESEPVDPRL